jgi:hypothetical protein
MESPGCRASACGRLGPAHWSHSLRPSRPGRRRRRQLGRWAFVPLSIPPAAAQDRAPAAPRGAARRGRWWCGIVRRRAWRDTTDHTGCLAPAPARSVQGQARSSVGEDKNNARALTPMAAHSVRRVLTPTAARGVRAGAPATSASDLSPASFKCKGRHLLGGTGAASATRDWGESLSPHARIIIRPMDSVRHATCLARGIFHSAEGGIRRPPSRT